MSSRPAKVLVEDILEAMEKIARYITDIDRDAFLKDERTADAVVRNLEIVGEAASRLPDNFKLQHENIPWRKIVGLRNRIVHEYFGVDLDIIWSILQNELPVFRASLQKIHNELS